MSTNFVIELKNSPNGSRTTVVILKDSFFDLIKHNWDQGIVGSAGLIGSGAGWWLHRGPHRTVELYDGPNDGFLVQLDNVSFPFKKGQSSTGDYSGPPGALTVGLIEWTVVDVN